MTDKKKYTDIYLVMAFLFCACLIVSNLMEIKTVDLGPLVITAGVITFPISYIINDCIVEIYGFKSARLMIWLGFAMNLFVVLFLQIGLWLPGSDSWQHQEAMEIIYGATPRVLIASFAAFLCGSLVNAYVMNRMKGSNPIGKGFSLRAIVSTIWGEGVDSVIFFPIAFAGIFETRQIVYLILTQTLLKTLYEILILPVTIRLVNYLKKRVN